MNPNIKKTLLISSLVGLSFVYYFSFIQAEDTLASRLLGRILLQVENNGEAWYVNPMTNMRHYLGRPEDAFALMKKYGLGISETDIKKIQIADFSVAGTDTDGDRLTDAMEEALGTSKTNKDSDNDSFYDYEELINGYDPNSRSNLSFDKSFASKLSGMILIQAEKNGEAWYLNPVDKRRYFLGRPADAFSVMRKTGLGISNADLNRIESFYGESTEVPVNVGSNEAKKYSDSDKAYSFEYPGNWTVKDDIGKGQIVHLRNYSDDVVKEKKAVITVAYIDNAKATELSMFKVAAKDGGVKTDTNSEKINDYEALTETFEFNQTDSKEISTYIRLSDNKIVRVTLFSAGNHDVHENAFNKLVRSVESITN